MVIFDVRGLSLPACPNCTTGSKPHMKFTTSAPWSRWLSMTDRESSTLEDARIPTGL